MSEQGYNGWKNYPTWVVHLWLTNDETSYDECLRTAGDAIRHSDTPRVHLADALREWHQEGAESRETNVHTGASVYTDLLGFALDQVDWFEIADAFLEDESLADTKRLAELGY